MLEKSRTNPDDDFLHCEDLDIKKKREGDEQLTVLLAEDLAMYFELLVLKYTPGLNMLIYQKFGREYLEDILQETFIRSYNALKKMPPEKIVNMKLKAWLYKIAFNTALNYKRDEKLWDISMSLSEVDEILDEQHSLPDVEIEQKEGNEELHECINRLPEPFRLVIFLHYICELDYQEISEVFSQPLNTIKSIGLRGVKKLRYMLIEER